MPCPFYCASDITNRNGQPKLSVIFIRYCVTFIIFQEFRVTEI